MCLWLFCHSNNCSEWSLGLHCVEKVVKNVNLLLKLVLGVQKAMLLELQQASAYNITEDWIWPYCKCLNPLFFLFFFTTRSVQQTLESSVLLLARKPQRNYWWDLCSFPLWLYLWQYCNHIGPKWMFNCIWVLDPKNIFNLIKPIAWSLCWCNIEMC